LVRTDIIWHPTLSRCVGRPRRVSVQPRRCPGPFSPQEN